MEVVKATFKKDFQKYLRDLEEMVAIPSVSFEGFKPEPIAQMVGWLKNRLKGAGFENVEEIQSPYKHPFVFAEKHVSANAPTLLLYAHYDVQPEGRLAFWKSHPFQATTREGPRGLRMYGRGTADDKAGILVHIAAVESFKNKLPVNIKLLIDGEEEIGSPGLEKLLLENPERFACDAIVVTDTANLDSGEPGLTISLRGIVELLIEVQGMEAPLHSGLWGGPIPDAAMGLAKILSQLVDEEGKVAVPGVAKAGLPLQIRSTGNRAESFREQARLFPGVEILSSSPNPVESTWNEVSVAVNALEASSRAQAGNILVDRAWAKVTLRVAPGHDPKQIRQSVEKFLKEKTPWGLRLTLKQESEDAAPWHTTLDHPAFEGALKALSRGYGAEAHPIGCGATIPFVRPFVEALGGVPALLLGVEDPYTNAHGENESLLLSDFEKACLSEIFLFEELKERIAK